MGSRESREGGIGIAVAVQNGGRGQDGWRVWAPKATRGGRERSGGVRGVGKGGLEVVVGLWGERDGAQCRVWGVRLSQDFRYCSGRDLERWSASGGGSGDSLEFRLHQRGSQLLLRSDAVRVKRKALADPSLDSGVPVVFDLVVCSSRKLHTGKQKWLKITFLSVLIKGSP